MEDEKLEDLSKKYYKPENCPSVVAPKTSSEILKVNLLSSLRIRYKVKKIAMQQPSHM